jgi:hypothetical protein
MSVRVRGAGALPYSYDELDHMPTLLTWLHSCERLLGALRPALRAAVLGLPGLAAVPLWLVDAGAV